MSRKYKAKRFETPDGVFDSRKEYIRFCELKLQEQAGEISDLKRQVAFEIIPSQKTEDGTLRAVKYIADFVYIKDGKQIVEDVKPTDKAGNISKSYKGTQAWAEYMLKKKALYYEKGVLIKEV